MSSLRLLLLEWPAAPDFTELVQLDETGDRTDTATNGAGQEQEQERVGLVVCSLPECAQSWCCAPSDGKRRTSHCIPALLALQVSRAFRGRLAERARATSYFPKNT